MPESSYLNQDESYFYLQGSGRKRKIKFHDYIEGQPLFYFAIAGRKNADVPDEFLDSKGICA